VDNPAVVDTLPYIDEHSTEVAADRAATWEALLRVVEGLLSSSTAPGLARLLGSADREVSGPRPLTSGSTLPGFHVETAEPPRRLALAGQHRFSTYALIFHLDELEGGTRLRAETRAAFPGLKGSVYRALVIGTRGHILATRRVLAAVKRRAERSPQA
jgi:hypothetical protein